MAKKDSFLQDLTKLIPGYGSYKTLESRREDDRLTRDFLAGRLQDCKKKLDSIGQAAVAAGDLDAPVKIEKLRSSIDLTQSRLRAALEGYAGWFSEKTVDEELLKTIGELDANLVSLVDQIDSILAKLKADNSNDFAELQEATELMQQRIDRRNEMLKSGS